MTDSHRPGRGLWVGLALGLPLMVYGARGAVIDRSLTHPTELVRWIVGLALGHDLVLVPFVLVSGWVLHRVVPARAWPFVRWALVTTGVLALFSWPFVHRYGVNPTVPSLLPRNYAAGLAAYIAAVWVAALAAFAIHGWRGTRRPSSGRVP
jgi:hypothetical protein